MRRVLQSRPAPRVQQELSLDVRVVPLALVVPLFGHIRSREVALRVLPRRSELRLSFRRPRTNARALAGSIDGITRWTL